MAGRLAFYWWVDASLISARHLSLDIHGKTHSSCLSTASRNRVCDFGEEGSTNTAMVVSPCSTMAKKQSSPQGERRNVIFEVVAHSFIRSRRVVKGFCPSDLRASADRASPSPQRY